MRESRLPLGIQSSRGGQRPSHEASATASVPVLLGGHALVSDGLRILVEASWLGR